MERLQGRGVGPGGALSGRARRQRGDVVVALLVAVALGVGQAGQAHNVDVPPDDAALQLKVPPAADQFPDVECPRSRLLEDCIDSLGVRLLGVQVEQRHLNHAMLSWNETFYGTVGHYRDEDPDVCAEGNAGNALGHSSLEQGAAGQCRGGTTHHHVAWTTQVYRYRLEGTTAWSDWLCPISGRVAAFDGRSKGVTCDPIDHDTVTVAKNNGAVVGTVELMPPRKVAQTPQLLDRGAYQLEVSAVICLVGRYGCFSAADHGGDVVQTSFSTAGAPDPPTDVTVTAGAKLRGVRLGWTVPEDTGGLAVTHYQFRFGLVEDYRAGFGVDRPTWNDANATCNGSACSTEIPNLPWGKYRFEVRAATLAGVGDPEAATGEPKTQAPGVPEGVEARARDASVVLAWQPPTDDEGNLDDGGAPITRYEYCVRLTTAAGCTKDTTADWQDADVDLRPIFPDLTLTVDELMDGSALENGKSYSLFLRAVNEPAGAGSGSEAMVVTPVALPNAPAWVSATVQSGSVALTWGAPLGDEDKTTASRYEYRWAREGRFDPWRDAGQSGESARQSVTVTGLVDGAEYTFEIRAVNDSGKSPSIEVRATPGPAPGAPLGLAATQSARQVTLTWEAVAYREGDNAFTRPVAYYECEYRELSAAIPSWQSCPVPPAQNTVTTIPNLEDGARYAFRIRACNVNADPCPSDGTGPWSDVELVVGAVLPAPSLAAVSGDRMVTLTWPEVTGPGGAVSRYDYRWGIDPAAMGSWRTVPPGDASARRVDVSGLANGVAYTFEVRAANAFGPGEPATVEATPATGLARVSLAAEPGERNVSLSWALAAGGADVLSYEYRWGREGALGEWLSVALETGVIVDGLDAGVEYTFEVRARTTAGPGPAAVAVAVPEAASASGLPAAPVALVATSGNRQVSLRWDAPPPGAFPVSAYEYRWGVERPEVGVVFGPWSTTGASLAVTVGGLDNGTTYTFEVRAVNRVGGGAEATAVATPAGVASAPVRLAAVGADGEVRLRWEAPLDDGGIPVVGYDYRYRADGSRFGDWTSSAVEELSAVVRGLTNGVTYHFEVRAETATGTGAVASVDAVPNAALAPPSVPRRLVAETLKGGTVNLTWATPSSDGGAAISRYEVRVRVGDGEFGAWTSAGVSGSLTLGGLVVGQTHVFEVRAVNPVGAGEAASVAARPASLPAAPARLTVEPAEGTVSLSWEAPESDGGAEISGYEYRVGTQDEPFGQWRPVGALSATVSALTNGVRYAFEVRAVNDVGAGPAAQVTAIPAAIPGPPAALAFARDGGALLRWEAPADDGGAPVLRYEYRWRTTGGLFGEWAVAGTALEVSVGGLTNDVEHTFEVRAVNGTGAGPGASARATPRAASTPAAPFVTAVGDVRRVGLAWEVPADDGGSPIRYYEYRWQPTGDAFGQWVSAALEREVSVDALVNGIEYVFEVRAVNDLGAGEAGTASAVPAAVPGQPALTLRSGSGEVDLFWRPPDDDGGLPLLRYEYRWNRDGGAVGAWTGAGLDTSATVRELVNGQRYEFAVRAVNARGPGAHAAGATTPTPGVADELMLDAWLGRFGRVAASHVVDAMDARFRVRDGVSGAARDAPRPRRAPPRPRVNRREDGRGDGGGRVRHRGGTGGRMATTGWAGGLPGAWPGGLMAASATSPAGGRWTAWGRLAATQVAGEDDRLGVEGIVATASGGADYRQGSLLAGIAVAHSEGRGDFRVLATDDFPERPGDAVSSRLTGTYPYLRFERGSLTAWGLLGRGSGQVTLDGQGPAASFDMGSTLGAFGARGQVATVAGLDVAVKSDAFLTRLTTQGDTVSVAGANRLRLLAEASRMVLLESGARLTLVGEIGGRHDVGAAERGGGMEVGGGVEYGGGRVQIAGRARSVLAHGDASLEEWGGVVSVAVRAQPSGRGLSLRLEPGWGVSASNVERYWSSMSPSMRARGVAATAGARLAAELGYGLAVRGVAVATPYARLDAAGDGQTWRLGWRAAGSTARLEVEALRRVAAGTAGHGILLRLVLDPWALPRPAR